MPYKLNPFTSRLDYYQSGSSGTGDVVGPASATDNAVARFDTTTGKLIQNSVVTVSDTGEMAGIYSVETSRIKGTPTGGLNISVDGEFDSWINPTTPTFWTLGQITGTGAIAEETTIKRTGTASIKFTGDGSNIAFVESTPYLGLTPGDVYTFLGYQRNSTGSGNGAGAVAFFNGSTTGTATEIYNKTLNSWVPWVSWAVTVLGGTPTDFFATGSEVTSFTSYTTTVPIPANGIITTVVLGIPLGGGAITVYVDDVSLTSPTIPATAQTLYDFKNQTTFANLDALDKIFKFGVTSTNALSLGGTGLFDTDFSSYNFSNKVVKVADPTVNADAVNLGYYNAHMFALPSQGGNSGKYLKTDGANPAWDSIVLASADFANQGTVSTVLHGNAVGDPSWGSIIESDISLSATTTNDATTLRHGFLPTLSGSSSQYLDGTGVFATLPTVAPVGATYITQTPDGTLTNEQALSTLATGYMKSTTGTGVVTTQAIPIPITDGGTGSVTAEFSPVTNLSTFNYYVATTGSDSNDGLTALTPFLTLEKAFNTIPMLMGGVFQVNIADGTYTLAARYDFHFHAGKSGTTDWPSVIKIVGNSASPGNVIVKASSATTTAFYVVGKETVLDVTGIDIQDCGIGFETYNAYVITRNVYITRYRTAGLQIGYHSRHLCPSGGTGLVLTCDGITTASAGINCVVFSISLIQSNFTCTGFKGASSTAVLCNINSAVNIANTTTTITADAAGAQYGLRAVSQSALTLSSTTTITNISVTSSSAQYGGLVSQRASAIIISGGTVNFVTCAAGFSIDGTSSANQTTATATYSYTTVTDYLILYHGAIANSHNYFNATGHIKFLSAFLSSPAFGYDDRYVRVDRPTDKSTSVSDINYTVLTTDSQITYTAITAARLVTLPTVASATTDMTAGQMRIFSVKDESGSLSAGNTITVSVSGGATIDGAASYVMNLAYGYAEFYCTSGGSNYFTKSST